MSYLTPIVIIRYSGKKPTATKTILGKLLPEVKSLRLTKGNYLTAFIDKKEKYVRIFLSQNNAVPLRILKIGCSTNFTRTSRWIGRTCNYYTYGKKPCGTTLENFSLDFSTRQKSKAKKGVRI